LKVETVRMHRSSCEELFQACSRTGDSKRTPTEAGNGEQNNVVSRPFKQNVDGLGQVT